MEKLFTTNTSCSRVRRVPLSLNEFCINPSGISTVEYIHRVGAAPVLGSRKNKVKNKTI